MRDAWKGLKTLSGQSKFKSDKSNMPSNKQKEFSDKLNDFIVDLTLKTLGQN